MTLREWLQAKFPDGRLDRRSHRGLAALVREARTSHKTLNKALDGLPIGKRDTAERISAATGGEVSIGELMHIEAPKHGGRAA